MPIPYFIQAGTIEEAADKAPWATVILRCQRGWVAFQSLADFRDWKDEAPKDQDELKPL